LSVCPSVCYGPESGLGFEFLLLLRWQTPRKAVISWNHMSLAGRKWPERARHRNPRERRSQGGSKGLWGKTRWASWGEKLLKIYVAPWQSDFESWQKTFFKTCFSKFLRTIFYFVVHMWFIIINGIKKYTWV